MSGWVENARANVMNVTDTVDRDALQNMVMVYGVQIGLDAVGRHEEADAVGMAAGVVRVRNTLRDDWWKWALGAGVVSAGAYAIYVKMTG